jgi:predicted nuclease of predicted toxin-antitoxin system
VKFLVDECLHLSLASEAQRAGYSATHVNWLGLAGRKDWELTRHIVDGDWIFVTNDARDFRRLYRGLGVHPGLIVLVPSVVPARQRALFAATLGVIQDRTEMINRVVETDLAGDTAVIREYDWPPP